MTRRQMYLTAAPFSLDFFHQMIGLISQLDFFLAGPLFKENTSQYPNTSGFCKKTKLSSTCPKMFLYFCLSLYFCIKGNQTWSLATRCVCEPQNAESVGELSFSQEACFLHINVHSIYFIPHTMHILLFMRHCPLCI